MHQSNICKIFIPNQVLMLIFGGERNLGLWGGFFLHVWMQCTYICAAVTWLESLELWTNTAKKSVLDMIAKEMCTKSWELVGIPINCFQFHMYSGIYPTNEGVLLSYKRLGSHYCVVGGSFFHESTRLGCLVEWRWGNEESSALLSG